MPGNNKSERSVSPAMNEDNRRELIARQHRALYGCDGQALSPSGGGIGDDGQRPDNHHPSAGTPTTMTSSGRGPSPRGVDPFGLATHQTGADTAPQTNPSAATGPSPVVQHPRSPSNSASSPGSGANAASYGVLEANHTQKPSHGSTSSPNPDSPSSLQGISKTPGASVGPIGSRPVQQQQPTATHPPNPSLNKRSTTPLPSPLSYGFSPNEVPGPNATSNNNGHEMPTSKPSAMNQMNDPSASGSESSANVGLGWPGGNTVWKSKNPLGVQASVWG